MSLSSCIVHNFTFVFSTCGSLATVWQGYFVFLNPLDVPGWRIWESRCGREGCQVLKRKASQWTIEGVVFGKCQEFQRPLQQISKWSRIIVTATDVYFSRPYTAIYHWHSKVVDQVELSLLSFLYGFIFLVNLSLLSFEIQLLVTFLM